MLPATPEQGVSRMPRSFRSRLLEGLIVDDIAAASAALEMTSALFVHADEDIPQLALAVANSRYPRLLATGDEACCISVVKTFEASRREWPGRLPRAFPTRALPPSRAATVHTWAAHRNGVLDLAWIASDTMLATASGDRTCALWDPTTHTRVSSLLGHASTVKAVSGSPSNPCTCTQRVDVHY